MSPKELAVTVIFAFIGWILCSAVIGIGMSMMTVQNVLIVHLFAAPVLFTTLSAIYFRKFKPASPLKIAVFFTGFVIFMDASVMAFIILRSFDMFASVIGTWIPFTLIFASTYLTGSFYKK
ncbi:MAG TPA: hypothetical protein VK436_08235 [Methanocella sp.]|nr:hypothetical protein [Methanocella sp.]